MIGTGQQRYRGQLKLQSAANTTITNKDIYYKVSGTFLNGNAVGFEVADNKIKFLGESGHIFHLSGVSDLGVNQACEIHYALFINGLLIPGSETHILLYRLLKCQQ